MPLVRIENYRFVLPSFGHMFLPSGALPAPESRFDQRREVMEQFAGMIRKAVVDAEVPGIDSEQLVTVVYGGKMVLSDNKTLMVMIEGLFDRADRTKEIRDHLAQCVGQAVKALLDDDWRVEVLVERFNTVTDSYWTSK